MMLTERLDHHRGRGQQQEYHPEGVAFEYDLITTAREAHDRSQQEVEHILKDLKRNP